MHVSSNARIRFMHSFHLAVLQALGKREPEQEREAQAWIESITGERFPEGDQKDLLLNYLFFFIVWLVNLQEGNC